MQHVFVYSVYFGAITILSDYNYIKTNIFDFRL